MNSEEKYECIVLGAGIAGLAAARTLAEAGRKVLVLEAEDQVGGRMRTLHIPGLQRPVDVGAEVFAGRPPVLEGRRIRELGRYSMACRPPSKVAVT